MNGISEKNWTHPWKNTSKLYISFILSSIDDILDSLYSFPSLYGDLFLCSSTTFMNRSSHGFSNISPNNSTHDNKIEDQRRRLRPESLIVHFVQYKETRMTDGSVVIFFKTISFDSTRCVTDLFSIE